MIPTVGVETLSIVKEKIYVAGHRGTVGNAIFSRRVTQLSHKNSCLARPYQLGRRKGFFQKEKPTQVYLAAVKVGCIYAKNTYPAEFIYQNLMMQTNIIDTAFRSGVHSSCSLATAAFTSSLPVAHGGKCLAHWSLKAHQRTLRHLQNYRYLALRKLQSSVRSEPRC